MTAVAIPLPSKPFARAAVFAGGLAALAGAVALIGSWAAFGLWLVPDITLLAGADRTANSEGRLAPRAVPLYNALHALPGPLALIGAGAATGPLLLGLGLVWLSHVLVDRAAGYGLRAPDGSVRA